MSELKKIVKQLSQDGIEYAICGGMALAILGNPRATIDINIIVDTQSIDTLAKNLKFLNFEMNQNLLSLGKISICRFYKIEDSGETIVLDILFLPDSMNKIWETTEEIMINNLSLIIVSPNELISLKQLRNNLQDQADIEYLRNILNSRN